VQYWKGPISRKECQTCFKEQQEYSTLDKSQNNNTDNKVIMYDNKNFVTFPHLKKKSIIRNLQYLIKMRLFLSNGRSPYVHG
jgi:hypothetical protein